METNPTNPADTAPVGRRAATRRTWLGGLAGAGLALAALTGVASTATAQEPDPADDLPAATDVDVDAVDAPDEHLVVFSADVRLDGDRVDEEWILAFGYEDEYPFVSSLWLLVDHDPVTDEDEWVPLCFGYTFGDEEGALFVGGSVIGDEDDGCLLATLGDDGGVVFGAIELEGESTLTAAMYPIF